MIKKIKFALAATIAMSALAVNANGALAHGYHHNGYGHHHNGYGHHHGCGHCCGH